jgi:hypothetical protein
MRLFPTTTASAVSRARRACSGPATADPPVCASRVRLLLNRACAGLARVASWRYQSPLPPPAASSVIAAQHHLSYDRMMAVPVLTGLAIIIGLLVMIVFLMYLLAPRIVVLIDRAYGSTPIRHSEPSRQREANALLSRCPETMTFNTVISSIPLNQRSGMNILIPLRATCNPSEPEVNKYPVKKKPSSSAMIQPTKKLILGHRLPLAN